MLISHHHGFSLLELLIALAISAILITISYPIYRQEIIKTHRADGMVALAQLASTLEQYDTLHHSYVGATLATLGSHAHSPDGFYRLQISSLTPTTYTIQATPIGSQQADQVCGSFILDQANRRHITGSGSVISCWRA